jgi:hypothetical protein
MDGPARSRGRLYLAGAAQDYIAESGGSGPTIQPMQPPPRAQKPGSRHMCGFSGVGSPGWTALGAAALALLILSLGRA